MMDRVFLINSWPFLVRHFRSLIDTLQEKVFDGCMSNINGWMDRPTDGYIKGQWIHAS